MPKVSKESAVNVEQHGPVEDRHEDIDGYAGSELVQFSPTEDLRAVDAVMAKNMQAMMQGS